MMHYCAMCIILEPSYQAYKNKSQRESDKDSNHIYFDFRSLKMLHMVVATTVPWELRGPEVVRGL